MSQETPARLADEIITTSGSPWLLSFARLSPLAQEKNASFGTSIAIAGRDVWSDLALWGSAPDAREAAAALKRSGYEILRVRSRPFCARRPLRGWRELDAEVRRLEALADNTSSLASFPLRRPRPPGLPKGTEPFAQLLFERLRRRHQWSLESVSVGRKGPAAFVRSAGWNAGAWCFALHDGDKRILESHVHVFSKALSEKVDSEELARLTRAFRSHLGPLGYKTAKITWPTKRRQFAVFVKPLPTLAVARRERDVLDRSLFGD